MLFLWQNSAQPILPLFGLIVSLVRLIITAVERIFPLVLIAPLQSPWSSVTQGPFVLHVSNTSKAASDSDYWHQMAFRVPLHGFVKTWNVKGP